MCPCHIPSGVNTHTMAQGTGGSLPAAAALAAARDSAGRYFRPWYRINQTPHARFFPARADTSLPAPFSALSGANDTQLQESSSDSDDEVHTVDSAMQDWYFNKSSATVSSYKMVVKRRLRLLCAMWYVVTLIYLKI